jgi:hypothetical protein
MPTWAEIKAEIQSEYDLSEETFVDAAELLQYANSAIEDIEKEIHTIHDKYFHAEANLSLVTNTQDYNLPSDIFANKITGIYYNNGGTKYEVKEIKDLSEIIDINLNDDYRYKIVNTTSGGTKIRLYPTSRETSSNITLFYRRRIKLFVLDADNLDVPEAKEFLKQYVIDKVANKERMTPDAQESPALSRKRKALLDSLESMIDDNNNEIFISTDFFEEIR